MFIGSQKSARWLHMGIGFEPQTSLLLGPDWTLFWAGFQPVFGPKKKFKKISK